MLHTSVMPMMLLRPASMTILVSDAHDAEADDADADAADADDRYGDAPAAGEQWCCKVK